MPTVVLRLVYVILDFIMISYIIHMRFLHHSTGHRPLEACPISPWLFLMLLGLLLEWMGWYYYIYICLYLKVNMGCYLVLMNNRTQFSFVYKVSD